MATSTGQFVGEALLKVLRTVKVGRSVVLALVYEKHQAAVVISSSGVGERFTPGEGGGKREAGGVALCKLDLKAVVV